MAETACGLARSRPGDVARRVDRPARLRDWNTTATRQIMSGRHRRLVLCFDGVGKIAEQGSDAMAIHASSPRPAKRMFVRAMRKPCAAQYEPQPAVNHGEM
jgi:hypothetical protein